MTKILLISILPGTFLLSAQARSHDDPKKAALTVLEQKCNVCHRINNPGRVFTIDNMEGLAPKIYKQVFVKRRMPKGNSIRLTEEESEVLKGWVETKM